MFIPLSEVDFQFVPRYKLLVRPRYALLELVSLAENTVRILNTIGNDNTVLAEQLVNKTVVLTRWVKISSEQAVMVDSISLVLVEKIFQLEALLVVAMAVIAREQLGNPKESSG